MKETDDIDILLTLHPYGWSTCYIFIEGKKFELTISHVFGDPYFDLITALTDIINNQKEVSFIWYGEPGGEQIEINEIKDRRDKVNVLINGFNESFGEEIKDLEKTVGFNIKKKHLITLFFLQMKKIFFLLKDRKYSVNRQNDFPFQEYLKFESLVLMYLNE